MVSSLPSQLTQIFLCTNRFLDGVISCLLTLTTRVSQADNLEPIPYLILIWFLLSFAHDHLCIMFPHFPTRQTGNSFRQVVIHLEHTFSFRKGSVSLYSFTRTVTCIILQIFWSVSKRYTLEFLSFTICYNLSWA